MHVTKKEKHVIEGSLSALLIVGILITAIIYLPAALTPGAILSTSTLNPPGRANCPGVGTFNVGAPAGSGGPPSNCLPLGMNLQIHLQNQITSASLTGWTCQIIWGTGNSVIAGVTPGTPNTVAETIANTGSNGNCVSSANLYYTGWSLYVKICHQSTACTTASYAQQEFVAIPPLPSGTVPFYVGTQSPTTTWTQPFTILILPMAGDLAATNTPITMSPTLANGTSIATASTCYMNEAAGTHTCYLGSGVYTQVLKVSLTNTYTTTTFPYGAGYTPFNGNLDPLNYNVGQLTTNLQMENKQASGSHPIPQISAGGAFTSVQFGSPIQAQSSTPDTIQYTGDLSTALTINQQSGFVNVLPGSVTFTFNVNGAAMTTSGDKATLTFNLYAYYSTTWVSSNAGSLNTAQAVTQMSQFTFSLQTH